jgi:ABC-2 type transport system ATP-binding protein
MGANKVIVFSTHILEEVEETCSRVIIIDRGRIVANGTPADLKARSARAGAVYLRARGMAGGTLFERLAQVPGAARVEIISEADSAVVARVYPEPAAVATLTRSVAEAAARDGWQLDEIHTEEGKLDEVFRAITLPDTVKAAA